MKALRGRRFVGGVVALVWLAALAHGADSEVRARLRGLVGHVAQTNEYRAMSCLQGADDGTTAELAALIDDKSASARHRFVAAIGMAYVRTAAARAVLLAHLGDGEMQVRLGCASALGYMHDETGEIRTALTKLAATDPAKFVDREGVTKYSVRDTAQYSLDRLDKTQPLATAATQPITIPQVGGPPPAAPDGTAPAPLQPQTPPQPPQATTPRAVPAAASITAEAAMAAALAFLADPALPAFPQHDNRFPFKPDARSPYWRMTLGPTVEGRDSHLHVGWQNGVVVDYAAGLPAGPYPETALVGEACQAVATEFARRQLPALFADGGEIRCTPQPGVEFHGAYLFRFERRQGQVRMPSEATVGVRAYDGKVVVWKCEPAALAVPVEPKLTLPQAQEALTAFLAKSGWVPVAWLETELAVTADAKGQFLVWDLKAEMRGARSTGKGLEGLCFATVDANDGTVRRREFPTINAETRRWYVSLGGRSEVGTAASPPRSLFSDMYPVVSPDGKRVLFSSTRPRAGYPAWLAERPLGLFLAGSDGTGLACLIPKGGWGARWSPDGRRVACLDDGIAVIDLATGGRVTFPGDRTRRYGSVAWLLDGRLAAIREITTVSAEGMYIASTVVALDPSQPDAAGVELAPAVRSSPDAVARSFLTADERGRLLYLVFVRGQLPGPGVTVEQARDTFRLCRLDPATGQEEELARGIQQYGRILAVRGDTVLLAFGEGVQMKTLDLATGAQTEWRGPTVPYPASTYRMSVSFPKHVAYGPDGSLLFCGPYWNGQGEAPQAEVIYTCAPDGSGARLITTPQRESAPTYVFPDTGKAAF